MFRWFSPTNLGFIIKSIYEDMSGIHDEIYENLNDLDSRVEGLGGLDSATVSQMSSFLNNLVQIEVIYPSGTTGVTVTVSDGTTTKSGTIDAETHSIKFGFGNYGVYTVTDDLTNTRVKVKAYHYGYYPVTAQYATVGSYVGASVNQ